ncbi:hypothetical protein [Cupriavidus basilensis]|uniref:hypothetical protein n=1 Tax=Cupriavidus basilensis TaxID=68895 RepID=UPI0007514EF7|nr:hypothetical protein [Cupriavidus basilensis]
MLKGFVVFVGHMEIRAMRSTPAGMVQACQSEADSYQVFQRHADREAELRRTEANFDTAFSYAVRRAILH